MQKCGELIRLERTPFADFQTRQRGFVPRFHRDSLERLKPRCRLIQKMLQALFSLAGSVEIHRLYDLSREFYTPQGRWRTAVNDGL